MLYDVVVVGGGIAGIMAAIEAKNEFNKVALITKGNIFKSNSSLASGGINAVLDESDEIGITKHIDDTLSASKGLGDRKAIEYMCRNASRIVYKLDSYGVDFAKDAYGGIAQRSFGGGSVQRTCYVGDKTGSAIMQVLIKKARSIGITFLVNTFVMNLTKYNDKVSGVVALRRSDSNVVVYPAKAVVLAGGGYTGIYKGFSTNAQDYTGDAYAIALRAGLSVQDMEFVQFHPTGMHKTNYLVSEAARGEGGYLVNSDGERFVDELATRDVVALAISKQIEQGKEVFIDLRHLELEQIESKLPSLYRAARAQLDIDVSKELLPIKPVAHYSMGGIVSNMCQTSLKGLFVCGECAGVGVHGANRLGGNSLLEGAVFGELAGKKARNYGENKEFLPIDYAIVAKDQKKVDKTFEGDTTKNFNAMRTSLGRTMFAHVGLKRDEVSLAKASGYIRYLRAEARSLHTIDKGRNNNVELIAILELRNALEVSDSIILSALERKESRGAHMRIDFEQTLLAYKKHIVLREPKRGFFVLDMQDKSFWQRIKNFIKT